MVINKQTEQLIFPVESEVDGFGGTDVGSDDDIDEEDCEGVVTLKSW